MSRPRGSTFRLVSLAALALAVTCSPAPRAPRPNVVLVVLDTLRADHLSFYGYGRETASYLARLAAGGTVFERAFSTSSWTAPATASLMTALYPTHHGIVSGFLMQGIESAQADADSTIELRRLPEDAPLLAEVLAEHGYATFGLATNVNIGREIGFDRGFDRFERYEGRPAVKVHKRLLEWREEIARAKPAFVYLHLNDVHYPYQRRERWFEPGTGEVGERVALYDSEIGFVDDVLERIHGTLGLGDDTLIVVVADHGEEFQDHGGWYHHTSLHQELNHVPMIVHAPGLGVPAERIGLNVGLVDVAPTILELVGVAPPAGIDGVSLAPLLRAGAGEGEREGLRRQLEDRTLLAHRRGPDADLWSVVRERWKLIVGPEGDELYDLYADPRERDDLAASHPELVQRLRVELERLRAGGIRSDAALEEVPLPSELVDHLRAIGYAK